MTRITVLGTKGVHREVAEYIESLPDYEVERKSFNEVLGLRPEKMTTIILSFVSKNSRTISLKFLSLNKDHIEKLLFLHVEEDLHAEQELLKRGLDDNQIVPVPSRASRGLPSGTRKILRNALGYSIARNSKYTVPVPPPPEPRWIRFAERAGAMLAVVGGELFKATIGPKS